ncbi:DUF6285 domain-containing protein [Azoarcus sp. KH32C]|uniref:DUF6285 domain-containing protein n=1 Tax=Azoarcus sp. KH32C TaxID=748247 RepID=UPI0002386292|nr:DUF6285 domain-containing protein [Azoarcus sp. KH32C]BAL24593.1 hypothetical protein AZKH_2287 [Azoarcus sp. KH32C]
MRDQPTGDQLLDTARAILREELIPALPADKRHAALMIANAMAIAARQLRNGDDPERDELANLARILSLPAADTATGALREMLLERNRELCRWIRGGRTDAGSLRHAVRKHLLDTTRRKVEESNPKALGGAA